MGQIILISNKWHYQDVASEFFILSIVFIQEQSKWNSTSFVVTFFWGHLNECSSSQTLPFLFILKI